MYFNKIFILLLLTLSLYGCGKSIIIDKKINKTEIKIEEENSSIETVDNVSSISNDVNTNTILTNINSKIDSKNNFNKKSDELSTYKKELDKISNLLKEKKSIKNFDCNVFIDNKVKEYCISRKLDDFFISIDDYSSINCEDAFNINNFPGEEKKIEYYKKSCFKRVGKIKEKINIKKKVDIIGLSICKSNKYNLSQEEKNKCEIIYSINSREGCEILNNNEKIQKCNIIKKDIENYLRMKDNFNLYGKYSLPEFLEKNSVKKDFIDM